MKDTKETTVPGCKGMVLIKIEINFYDRYFAYYILVVVCVLWLIDDTFGFLGKWRDTVCTKSTRHCTLCQIQKMLTNVAPSYDPSVPFHALPSYHSRVGYVFNIK